MEENCFLISVHFLSMQFNGFCFSLYKHKSTFMELKKAFFTDCCGRKLLWVLPSSFPPPPITPLYLAGAAKGVWVWK
jgi:hypothetical protein